MANLGSEIREFQDLQTHLSCRRNFTGSLYRISVTRSNGRVSSDGALSESQGGPEEEEIEGNGDVSVPV